MVTHDDFVEQKDQALVRLARLETKIQTQIATTQGTVSQIVDGVSDAGDTATGAVGSVLGTVWDGVKGAGTWVWDHVPGRDMMQSIARRAYNAAVRELEAHGSTAGLGTDLQEIENDPMGFAKKQYDKRKVAAVDPAKEHFEGPRGTMLADGLTWVLGNDFPDAVIHKVPASQLTGVGGAATPVGTTEVHLSDAERTYLYLDVGRWGGINAGSEKARRDFGIVCGRTAVLCAWRAGAATGSGIGSSIPDSRQDIPARDRTVINKFLHTMAAAGSQVLVVRALASTTVVPEASVVPNTLHIYLGDMHLPVVTDLDPSARPDLQLGRFEFDDAAWRKGLQASVDVNDRVVNLAKRKARDLVPTRWQSQVMPTIDGMIESMRMSRSGYMGTVGTFDKQLWLGSYGRADIFKEADADLMEFITRVEAYQHDATAHRLPPVHLMQLGDMFDLWIGMLCFFLGVPETATRPHFQLDGLWAMPTAQEYVNYWVDSAMFGTQRSEAVVRFLSYSGQKTFLYGNHDNYLSPSGVTPPALSAVSGGTRKPALEVTNLFFAEHGHRVDSFNRDGATLGWFITQSAFRQPAVRSIEPSSRFDQVKGASAKWLERARAGAPYCHYVMGHTHVPVLTRVTIESL